MKPAEIKELTSLLIDLQTQTRGNVPQEIEKKITSLKKQLRLAFVELAVVEVMSRYYDFGEVRSVTRLFGGLINQNFSVSTNDGRRCHRLFIKRYNKNTTLKEVLVEHKFNEHLCANDFPEVARCIPTTDGRTFVNHLVKHIDEPDDPSIFAVYSYLEGEDRYDWLTPHCSMADLASASGMLAKIHEKGYDFDAGELIKEEPKILQLMDEFPQYYEKFKKMVENSPQTKKSYTYFMEKMPSYLSALEKCKKLKQTCADMLEVMVHGDFHPGNQKYSDNGVVGVFDFDWCKRDLRLFDVAITITYFCTSWKEHEDGVLFLDEIQVFLDAYQQYLKGSDRISPLSRKELESLPEMIILANMYVVWWDLQEVFNEESSESDEEECLVYLTHNTKINDFALSHLKEIRCTVLNTKSEEELSTS